MMKILVLGAGMYVTGREKSGVGTVLCALAQTSKTIDIEEVTIVAMNPRNKKNVLSAAGRINQTLNTSLSVRYQSMNTETASFRLFLKKNYYDCAIVCLPDHLHFKATKAVLESGIHCLVVKPLTPTVVMARELIAIQRRKKLYAAVEFHKRFDETNLYIKRAINEKMLGKILFFTVDYSQHINIPLAVFKLWAEKTNIFQYLGVHYVDLIYFLTGYLPSRAMGVGTKKVLTGKGLNTYDSVHATIEWRNPHQKKDVFVSQFNTSWVDPNNSSALSDQKYKVIGTKGRIECDQKNRGIEVVHESLGIKHINPYFSEYLYDPNGQLEFGGYGYKSINLFINDVNNLLHNKVNVEKLEKTRPTFHQALVSTAVVEAVNRSLKDQSRWKEINDLF
jgi:predicted dehydrogenase